MQHAQPNEPDDVVALPDEQVPASPPRAAAGASPPAPIAPTIAPKVVPGLLEPQMIPIGDLHHDAGNARRHPEKNLRAIRDSLSQFGQRKPLVAQRQDDGTLIVRAGNGTLEAARQLGWATVAVTIVDEDNATAAQFAIADNRTGELAEWDDEALAGLLDGFDEGTKGLLGFDDDDLADLSARMMGDAGGSGRDVKDDGADEPSAVAVAKRGDLWQLGEHRLLCGDSTNLKDVLRVMAGEKAALVATDPRYLVDYTGERPNDTGKDWSDKYREIDIKDADGFFKAVFTNVLEVLGPHAAIYCWHAHKRCGDIQRIWRDLGILDHQQIMDVAIRRWEKATGQQATIEGTNQTFVEVAAQRGV